MVIGGLLALGAISNLVNPAEEDTDGSNTDAAAAVVDPTPTPVPTSPPEPTTVPQATPAPDPTPTSRPAATPVPTAAPTATPLPTTPPAPTPTSEPVELTEEQNEAIAALAIRFTVRDADPVLGVMLDAQSDRDLVSLADSICDIAGESATSEDLVLLLLLANGDAMEADQVAMLAGASMGARCPDELARLGLD